MILTILSGGQTGVDRGALDAALAAGAPCEGWCPRGRRAEDGSIPSRYPLRETPSTDYEARTLANVRDSDATAILFQRQLVGGSALTRDLARSLNKPCLSLDVEFLNDEAAAVRLTAFVRDNDARRLNLAGPRSSNWPEGRDRAFAIISAVLAALRPAGGGS